VHAFGRKIEVEGLDRNEPIALGIVRTQHRAERPRANLMKNPKRAERVRRRASDRVRAQQGTPQGRQSMLARNVRNHAGRRHVFVLSDHSSTSCASA
jgi:hypothetical protein